MLKKHKKELKQMLQSGLNLFVGFYKYPKIDEDLILFKIAKK
jgi:hypothetical protein